jgi:hypothetical protein
MEIAMKPLPDIFATVLACALIVPAGRAAAEIRRDPNGVNVKASGATTVLITFGGLRSQVATEALWCGALLPAAPHIGFKCDPATIFGQLPIRYDISRSIGGVFTDVMSIPPSVARRAYQAAQRGERSSFFYVRRFVSTTGGPDEYVFVTCRLAGGGARVPFALLDVHLAFAGDDTVTSVKPGDRPPPLEARIAYNGTGRLRGRWEVVLPGEELPGPRDLLTEASLPAAERPLQRRYTSVHSFSVFLPPTGSYLLAGPDVSRLPTGVEGLHLVLLRIEAADDKEGDSNLALAGAGTGVLHSGAVAGFPMPVLRYFVGAAGPEAGPYGGALRQLFPVENATIDAGRAPEFTWSGGASAGFFRLEITDPGGQPVLEAMLQPGVGAYRAPTWLREKAPGGILKWRVVALGPAGETVAETSWREVSLKR